MQVILSASSKGGVGKSEIAKLTAYQLSRDGHDVAMMDADIDSSNLSSRMGVSDRVEHTDDDLIQPVTKDGIKVYSMESAFQDSSFSQSGDFMRVVIRNMVSGAAWDDPDYLVVDCPPGTKDIFDELVKVLREDILGAIVIGQSDTVDDVGRMTKVCNHNYVPIVGYIENMSGIWAEGELLMGPKSGNPVAPFGQGRVEALAKEIGGRYLGPIPLCDDHSEIESAAANTIKSIAIAVGDAEQAPIPDLKEGDKGFIRNVLNALKATVKTVNSELDVKGIQKRFGNPDNPKVICLELTDASGSWMLPSKVHLKVEGGLKILRNPDEVYGGIKISSQELKFALEGERMTMDSPTALYQDDAISSTKYGLVDAVQMGKASVYGDDVINYLSLLDKIFNEVIDQSKIQQAVKNS
ncbi:MAG: ATPase involved in chromosome partitioning [Candidatus Nanosalina sp. J07AB43]|jgi:ATPases involved in chromosome partitioning|nr:MAG: ATPase involved in chromosome partitioning [Candidatus Nanosalina sp. J07AB43]